MSLNTKLNPGKGLWKLDLYNTYTDFIFFDTMQSITNLPTSPLENMQSEPQHASLCPILDKKKKFAPFFWGAISSILNQWQTRLEATGGPRGASQPL